MKKRQIHDIFVIAKRVNKKNEDTKFVYKDIIKDSMSITFWMINYVHNSL
jgi:hypothetical protein